MKVFPFKGERDHREGGDEGIGEMHVYLYSHRGSRIQSHDNRHLNGEGEGIKATISVILNGERKSSGRSPQRDGLYFSIFSLT